MGMQIGQRSFGCGDFQFQTENNNVFCARSMEFPKSMKSEITIYPAGEEFKSYAPLKNPGLKWTSQYSYVGINGLHIRGISEGMNKAGLSFGFLTLLNSKYQTVSENQSKQALALMDVGDWILGNFKTVDEVKEAIKNVIIWEGESKVLGNIPGLHIALHDAQGKNLVIEFIDGEVVIHENPNGVLTNNPILEEQLQNLEKYNYLSAEPFKGKIGGGMEGLPGDDTSESRFIRLSKALQFALKPKNETEAIVLATHILNTVDIVKGTMIVPLKESKLYETTLWRTIKDLTNKIFYFSTYNDPTIRKVDLRHIDDKKIYNKLKVQVKEPTIIDISRNF